MSTKTILHRHPGADGYYLYRDPKAPSRLWLFKLLDSEGEDLLPARITLTTEPEDQTGGYTTTRIRIESKYGCDDVEAFLVSGTPTLDVLDAVRRDTQDRYYLFNKRRFAVDLTLSCAVMALLIWSIT